MNAFAPHRHRAAVAARCLVLLTSALLAATAAAEPSGCDSIASVPITWNIDYDKDIQTLFANRCSNCHVDHGGTPAGDLDLDPKWSYDNLVNGPSAVEGILVVPGNPLSSVLFQKINCNTPEHGLRMPRLRPALPLAEQALIHDWIMLGAPRITDTIFANGFEPRP
ncbi:MAG TPA: hypothetical protein PKO41_04465 [Dokdonella sp.]|uniref:hypothetical protein n=1 Tax=Dokdonella sp. TaxID=2291710 RepID=UPI0025C418A2|nr:hypothetical protein [Dokdonella sp.]MBX3692557.1 hypothetical protein [Dokdonella sp.]MCW5567406.1 hypothetical protein [Dokdonella sp.]HNR91663.1 hypothetical protein [Dokdonella sp.]